MQKKLLAAGVLLVALVACQNTQPTNPPAPPTPPVTPPVGGTACPATITTSSNPNAYSVSSCTIKVGATITIQGSSMHPLNVVGGGQNIMKQASNATGIAFSKAETVNVFCSNHAGMTMTITVEQ